MFPVVVAAVLKPYVPAAKRRPDCSWQFRNQDVCYDTRQTRFRSQLICLTPINIAFCKPSSQVAWIKLSIQRRVYTVLSKRVYVFEFSRFICVQFFFWPSVGIWEIEIPVNEFRLQTRNFIFANEFVLPSDQLDSQKSKRAPVANDCIIDSNTE